MPTTFLVDDATNTPFTSGSAGVQVVVGTATSINGSPIGALAGLVGNFALDTSTNTLWACTASGTSGSAQWEQVLTDPSLYALINGSSGQVFNVADATQDSEAVNLGQLTDGSLSPSFASGTFRGQLSIPDATASGSAINYGQAFQLLSGTPPSSITLGNTLHTVAQFTLTASGSVTLEPGSVVGQEITIYGGAYALTVNSNVTSGSPYFLLPDESEVYSWTIPASGFAQGIRLDWDGTNWRARTFGQTVVAPATQNNAAVQLGRVLSVTPQYNEQAYTPASGDTYTISNSFTAPCSGFILAASTINMSGAQPVACGNKILINGTSYGGDSTPRSMTNWGAAAVTAGTACTVTSSFTAGSSTGTFNFLSQTVMSIFIPNP